MNQLAVGDGRVVELWSGSGCLARFGIVCRKKKCGTDGEMVGVKDAMVKILVVGVGHGP